MKVHITYEVTHTLDLPDKYLPLYEAAKKAEDFLASSSKTQEDWNQAYVDWPEDLAKEFKKDMAMLFPYEIVYAQVEDENQMVTIYEA